MQHWSGFVGRSSGSPKVRSRVFLLALAFQLLLNQKRCHGSRLSSRRQEVIPIEDILQEVGGYPSGGCPPARIRALPPRSLCVFTAARVNTQDPRCFGCRGPAISITFYESFSPCRLVGDKSTCPFRTRTDGLHAAIQQLGRKRR